MLKSEYYKGYTKEEIERSRARIDGLNDLAIQHFRNSLDPDFMGFDGAEGVSEDEYRKSNC